MRLFEIQLMPSGSALPMPLYHGSEHEFSRFTRATSGVFFSPHPEWAENYGLIIKKCYVWAPKVYSVDYTHDMDDDIIDALFDRDYGALSKYISELKAQGYYALQTVTDSEMVCAFDNARIYCDGVEL